MRVPISQQPHDRFGARSTAPLLHTGAPVVVEIVLLPILPIAQDVPVDQPILIWLPLATTKTK